jgi:hypothetical protein
MVARYRQVMLRDFADGLRTVGQATALQYRAAHADDWRPALDADMATLRTSFEQDPDQKRFCKQAAIRARDVAGGLEISASGFRDPANVENDFRQRQDRIR